MKYLKKYFTWKEVNEELEETTSLSAADKLASQFPERAHDIRNKVVPGYDEEFQFFFFPEKADGNKITFRAYVDSRENANKLAKIIKSFYKLSTTPQANNFWRELGLQKKEEAVVMLDQRSEFVFYPDGPYFVTGEYAIDNNMKNKGVLRAEIPWIPKVLIMDHFKTHYLGSNRWEYQESHFRDCGPSQIVKIYWDEKDKCLKSTIDINTNDEYIQHLYKKAGVSFENEVDENEVSSEEIQSYRDVLKISEQRPKAAIERLVELQKDVWPELSELLNSEWTFILRKVTMDQSTESMFQSQRDWFEKYLGMGNSNYNARIAYVTNDKDADNLLKLVKLFQAIADPRREIKINPDNLVTEKKEGDVEVKAKFRIKTDEYGAYSLTGNDFQFVFNAKDFFEEKDLSDMFGFLTDEAEIRMYDNPGYNGFDDKFFVKL